MNISRRAWLKRMATGAGAALLSPFFTQLAHAQGRAPRRFLFVVEGNGFEPVTLLGDPARAAIDATTDQPLGDARWWYRSYRHAAPLEVAGGLGTAPALGGLAELADRAAVLFGLSSKITGGGHSARHGALASARSTGGAPGGITIDAWLGARATVRQQTPFDVVRLGVSDDASRPLDFGTCAYGRGRAAPMLLQPDKAFRALFGSVGDAQAGRAFEKRGGQLDFAAADVRASLQVFSGNSAERAKLETYLASIEALQARRARLIALGPQLRAARPAVDGAADAPLDRFTQQLDLAAAALLGGLTNVCVVGCGSGGDFGMRYPGIIQGVGRHDLHHGSAANPAYRAAIHTVTRRQVDAIAGVARRLAAAPDVGGGSVLENTLIVYIGDNGEQHHSTASEFPVLLIGGQGMGLRIDGRTWVYPGLSAAGHRQISNLWNLLGHVAGEALDDFGAEGPTRRAAGPLGGLLA